MKILTILCFLLLTSSSSFGARALLIGDSHTAGPFGSQLHRLLSIDFEQVITLGHSSSAAYHWVNEKDFLLSGGKFNQMFFNGKQFLDPNPIDWRLKVSVPKLSDILNDNAHHEKWKQMVGEKLQADIVIIALGANDARTIADNQGNIIPNGYKLRRQAIIDMISSVKHSGAKCIWIAPPHGIKKSDANQKTLYHYLRESIGGVCPMMDSNHYKATGCDGVHFSCSSQRHKAINWAKEAHQFILNHI